MSPADEALAHLAQESDKRLATQLQILMASDLRVNTILVAATTLATGSFGLAVEQWADHRLSAPVVGSLAFGLAAALSALSAACALWPSKTEMMAWFPPDPQNALARDPSYRGVVSQFLTQNQSRIAANEGVLWRCANHTRWAIGFLVSAPFLGLLFALIRAAALGEIRL